MQARKGGEPCRADHPKEHLHSAPFPREGGLLLTGSIEDMGDTPQDLTASHQSGGLLAKVVL